MKNLLTLLLLVMSLLAFGQSNSQSLEVEINYWKSIAESNDTVAYRDYLQRYGEDGLYKDEAKTRIALLKASGKQAHSINTECCFYSQYGPKSVEYVVRFESNQEKIWLKHIKYDTVRYILSISQNYYESRHIVAQSRSLAIKEALEYAQWIKEYSPLKYPREKRKFYRENPQALSRDYYKDAWDADEEYAYDPMKSTAARDVYFKRDNLNKMQGYRYVAFSKDKTSFIMWFEQDNNLDGVIREKREYKLVPKEELLPKSVNYDFLNE